MESPEDTKKSYLDTIGGLTNDTEDIVDNELVIDSISIELNTHKVLKYYKCKVCVYRTMSLQIIHNHLDRHRVGKCKLFHCNSELEPYMCEECYFSTPLRISLKKHIQMSQSVLGVTGNNDFKFSAIHLLHVDEKQFSKTYKCWKCSHLSQSKLSCIMHRRKCQLLTKKKKKKPKHKCTFCVYVTKSTHMLDQHVKLQHPPLRDSVPRKNKYVCCQCPFRCSVFKDLTKHTLKHKQEKSALVEVPRLVGPEMEPILELTRVEPIAKHREKVRSRLADNWFTVKHMAPFNCMKCGFVAKKKKQLDEHVVQFHGLKPCTDMKECHFNSNDVKELNEHILMKHVSTKTIIQYTCHLCHFLTTEGKDLMKHLMEEHVFPRQNKRRCELCGRDFEIGNLKKHILNEHIL